MIRITINSQTLSESLEDFTAIRDEDELDELQITPHPYDLANSVGIRISRASEFAFGLAKDGKLAGALFTEIDDDVMMFDIVVDPTFRRLGIADKFIRYAIMLFRGYESDGLVESLSANVVNPRHDSSSQEARFRHTPKSPRSGDHDVPTAGPDLNAFGSRRSDSHPLSIFVIGPIALPILKLWIGPE